MNSSDSKSSDPIHMYLEKFPEQDPDDRRFPFVPRHQIVRLVKYYSGNMTAIRAKAAEAVERGTPLTKDEVLMLAGQSPASSKRTSLAASSTAQTSTAARSGMLTPSELKRLRQSKKEAIAYGQKAFPPKTKT